MLINLDKLKSDNEIKSKLQEGAFEKFVKNTKDYFKAVENDINKANPSEALNIISMLSSFKEYFNSDSDWENLTLRSLDILRKGIGGGMFHKHAVFSGMSHVAFIVHNLSKQTPSIKPFLDAINKILLDNLTSYLKKSSPEELYEGGSYEVITGLSGPLRYLLEFENDEQMLNMTNDIIEIFTNRSKEKTISGHKVTGWHYYPSSVEKSFMTHEAPNGVVNYGLSHGMAGPLVTLSMAYKQGIRKDGLEDAINGLISEYMDMPYYVNDIIYWPGRITLEQRVGLEETIKNPGQMSWCYSSIGILRSLYLAGVFMSNTEVERFAVNEFLKIANTDIADFLLPQSIVCHGLAGTAAVINKMYLDTGIVEFHTKAIEMAEASALYDIESYFESEKQLAKNRNTPSRAALHEYLEGYSGILQSVLSIVKVGSNENEKRLLIV